MTTPLVELQKPKDISVAQIEAELSEIWREQQAGSLATRAATFSMVIYEPEEFQQLLTGLGFYKGAIDGIHGPATKAAVLAAQRKYGLRESGRVGPRTLARLREELDQHQEGENETHSLDMRGFGVSDAIASQNPCRIITLCPVIDSEEPVSAQVSAYCPIQKGDDGALMCCEYITLKGTKPGLQSVGDLVRSLVIPELPKFVWWKATPNPEQPLFQALAEASDCMIFDSCYFSEPKAELLKLKQLLDEQTFVADLNWHRLAAWQELAAAAYDAPDRRSDVFKIDRVTLDYEKGNPAQALMYLGWLASRLNWIPVSLSTEAGDYDILRVKLRSEDDRDIEAELAGVPVGDWGEIPGDLIGLRLMSSDPQANCATILCSETTGCMRMESGGSAQTATTHQVSAPADETAEGLMSQQLQSWGRNVLYEESLAVTVQILKLQAEQA